MSKSDYPFEEYAPGQWWVGELSSISTVACPSKDAVRAVAVAISFTNEAFKEVARLQAENQKVSKACELWLKLLNEAIAERDTFKAEVERLKALPHGQILAESAGRYLLSSGAENFVGEVFTIEADDGTTKFEVVVTTQKVGAKSPGEVCNELQSELTKALELLEGVKGIVSKKEATMFGSAPEVMKELRVYLAHQSTPAKGATEDETTS